MLLAIDAGNTNIVFAVFNGEDKTHVWRLNTDADCTVDQYTALLYPLFERAGLQFSDIDNVIISSVVPDANYNLQVLCDDVFGCEALFVTHKIVSDYIADTLSKPEEIGADRLVNTVAVAMEYETPTIVIDFGTATTFDLVDKDGRYTGGIIAPGANLSMKALHQAAAQLPSVKIEKIDFVKGTNTIQAIQSGIYWGYVSMIEGLIEKLTTELGAQTKVIATGGLAKLYADAVPAIDVVDNELTLKGLLKIYRMVKNDNVVAMDNNSTQKEAS